MSETTYYQGNREVILNRVKDYYKIVLFISQQNLVKSY